MPHPTGRLLTNVFSSWAGFVIRIIIAFFFVPYITATLGDARYGIWILVFQIVNYFFLFDVGLERALLRFLPRYLGLDDHESFNRVLNSATAVYGAIALVTLIASALTASYLFPLFDLSDPSLLVEGQTALFIIGVFVALRFLFFPFGGSLGAMHRFDIAKSLEVVEEIGKTAVYVLLLSKGYGLVALAITMASFSLARNIAGVVWLKRLHPEVRFGARFVTAPTIKMLFRYSRISFGVAIAWMVLFNSDSILLGVLATASTIGVYAPGAQLMLYVRHLINAVGVPLTPLIAHVDATDSIEKVQQVYLKSLTYVSYLGVFLCVGIIAYASRFVTLWLDPGFHDSYLVMFILAISGTVFLPQIVGNAVLFGIEKHRYLLWILSLEILMKVGLAFVLFQAAAVVENGEATTNELKRSVILLASASALPQALLSLTLYPALMARALKLRIRTIWHTTLVSGGLAAAITGPTAHVGLLLWNSTDWWSLSANILLCSLLAGAGFYLLVLEPDDRFRLRAWAHFWRRP